MCTDYLIQITLKESLSMSSLGDFLREGLGKREGRVLRFIIWS